MPCLTVNPGRSGTCLLVYKRQRGAPVTLHARATTESRFAECGPRIEYCGRRPTPQALGDWRELTFAKGASLKDPAKRFNSSLDGNARRN